MCGGPTHHTPAGVLELIHDGHFVAVVVVAAGLGMLCDNVHRLLDEVVKVHEVFVTLGDFDVAQAGAHKPRAVCVSAVNKSPSDAVSANLRNGTCEQSVRTRYLQSQVRAFAASR